MRLVIDVSIREVPEEGPPITVLVTTPKSRRCARGLTTVGGAIDWALREVQAWMRSRNA